MSNKLMFIMSDSDVYLRDEVLRISKNWGFTKSNVKTVEEWNPALVRGSMSLFGDTSMTHLDLSDKNKLKKFADLVSSKKEKQMFEGNWYGAGLIITSIHAQGAKRIENFIKKHDGEVIKKAKPAEMKKKLLARVSLNRQTKEFLNNYVGEDFQILVSIVNQLGNLTKQEQENMTVDELIVRLPSKPGSVPPWDFVNPMMEGKTQEAIDLFKRGVEGSHVLVTMQLSRTKLQLLYRVKLLELSGIWKSAEQAKILGERNNPGLWNTAKTAKKLNLSTTEYLAKLALKTEADLKGNSSVDPHVLFMNFIAATCLAINYNVALPLDI